MATALSQPATIDLRVDRLNRTIVRLAAPAVMESLLSTMVFLVDTVFVVRLNDAVALAAVGLSSTLIWAADGLFQAISISASAMVARFWGREDFEGARQVAGQALILSVLAAVLLTTLLVPLARPFLQLMGAEPLVAAAGASYLHILLATSLVSFPLSVANSMMRATGDTQKPMYVTGLMNLFNVGASYALIFGLGAIPRLELRGAALSTSVARTLGGIMAIGILFSARTPIQLRLSHLARFDPGLIWRMLRISGPNVGETLVSRLGFMLFARILAALGTVAVAAHQVAQRVESLAYMPAWGMATAAAALVGQALGARQDRVAELGIRRALLLGNGGMALIGLGLSLFAGAIVRAFGVQDPALLEMATAATRISALELIGLCSFMILSGCMRGAGDTRTPMIVALIGTFLLRVPVTYLFAIAWHGGLRGLWLGTAVDWSMRALITLILYRQGRWKTIQV